LCFVIYTFVLCNHRGRWLTGRRWCGAWVAPLF